MSTTGTGDSTRTFAWERRSNVLSAVLARNWWAVASRGVLGMAVGVIAFVMPAGTMLALVLLFAAYMLVDAVFAIIAAVRAARQHDRWGLVVLEGIVDIVAGIIALLWPGNHCARLCAPGRRLGHHLRRPYGGGRLPSQYRARSLVARSRRRSVGRLRRAYDRGAADRGAGADLVVRRLCAGVRHYAFDLGVPP